MTQCFLALGYLVIPVTIECAVTTSDALPMLPQILSVTCFVTKPPTTHPTIAKYIIRPNVDTSSANREMLTMFSQSLHGDPTGTQQDQRRFAIVSLENYVGIISSTQHKDVLTLQLVWYPPISRCDESTYQLNVNQSSRLIPEAIETVPLELLQLCQQAHIPSKLQRLRTMVNDVYRVVSVHGYWDMWRVVEGICARFQMDANQFISPLPS